MVTKLKTLDNNTEFFYKQNKDTPRVALCFDMSLNEPMAPGVYAIMARLFMQGTRTYSAEQLAEILDRYAIEFSCEMKTDYLKLKFVCLNEDFTKALDIFEDIVKNSTFDDFEKEREKLRGEIEADLDSPRAKVIDNYYKNIYANHHYGYSNTVIAENLDNITKQDILNGYNKITTNSKKVIAFVGTLDFEEIYAEVNKRFGNFYVSSEKLPDLTKPVLSDTKEFGISKPDTNQAHILKGWLVDNEDYPVISLLNIILGASGLSSRLFLELRDKRGLAYVVRSSYDMSRLGSNFSIYIATEPNNISVSLKGFEEELKKIKTESVSTEELTNAVNNLKGKWAFSQEGNSAQASIYAHYGVTGLGFDFNDRAKLAIEKVTPEQIKQCANKYFNEKYVLSVVKP